MVDSVVYFDLPSDPRNVRVSEAELKDLAATIRDLMRKRDFSIGDLIGSATDLWGFSIDFENHELLFSVSPNQRPTSPRWYADVLLNDPGWFKSTREHRLAQMKLVERAVHGVLTADLRARNVAWFLGKGRIDQRQGQAEP